jgi:phage baseplate assembly protein W
MATKRKTPVRLYKDIDMDFTVNPVTGDIGKKYDVNSVKQALRNLFLYQRGEKKFNPNFGSGIRGLLFEPVDNITASILEKEIQVMVENYEPRVRIDNIFVVASPDTNDYEVRVDFYVIGVREPQVYTTMLERLR